MRIFLAGATGVLGRELTPLLLQAGHEVAGMTRSSERAAQIRAQGPRPSSATPSIRRPSARPWRQPDQTR
jgi:uncharacterized protein YbjT (DUF2867 family)